MKGGALWLGRVMLALAMLANLLADCGRAFHTRALADLGVGYLLQWTALLPLPLVVVWAACNLLWGCGTRNDRLIAGAGHGLMCAAAASTAALVETLLVGWRAD
jgi:hypothetical protein